MKFPKNGELKLYFLGENTYYPHVVIAMIYAAGYVSYLPKNNDKVFEIMPADTISYLKTYDRHEVKIKDVYI